MHCCAGGRIGTGFFESSFFEKIWGRCARTGRGGKDDAANEDVTHGCLCVKIIWATKAQAPAAWVGNTAGERERLCFPAAGGGGDARWGRAPGRSRGGVGRRGRGAVLRGQGRASGTGNGALRGQGRAPEARHGASGPGRGAQG